MAFSVGSEKLENTTMAQNSDFIIGKNKFEYREKQQRFLVLTWNWWNKKRTTKKTLQTRKKYNITKSTINNDNNDINNRSNFRKNNVETTNFNWYQKCFQRYDKW